VEGLGFFIVFIMIFTGGLILGARGIEDVSRDEGYKCALIIEEITKKNPADLTEDDNLCLEIFRRIEKNKK